MQVTAQGVVALDQAGYEAAIRAAFLALVNENLGFGANTPQGQTVSILGDLFGQGEEGALHAINGLDRDTAVGYQLDGLGSLLHIRRLAASQSSATVTFTGSAGSAVTNGDLLEDDEGNQWALTADGAIAAGATTVDVDVASVDYGPGAAAAGDITKLVTIRTGIDSVTNAAAAVAGRYVEGDPAYRLRQDDLVGQNSSGSLASIRSALVEVATHSRVEKNDTAADTTVQNATIPAHGIRVVVHGGTDAEIAEAIRVSKGVGTATAGGTTVDDYSFDRAVTTALAFSLTVVKTGTYPANGDDLVKAALVAYSAGWGIGEDPDTIRLLAAAVTDVPGFMVTAHALTIQVGGGALPATPDLATLYTLATVHVTITT